MMDSLRRSVIGLFYSNQIEKAVMRATFDDTIGPQKEDLQEILEGCIGASKLISSQDTIEMLQNRLERQSSWRVILKMVLLSQYCLLAPQTTINFVKTFLCNLDILRIAEEFAASEDAQAASHAEIVRCYASFLAVYSEHFLSMDSILSKLNNVQGVTARAKSMDFSELLRGIQVVKKSIRKGLATFLCNRKFTSPHGFCDLTSCTLRTLMRVLLSIYSVMSILVMEMLDQVEARRHSEDMRECAKAYKSFINISESLLAYCCFMKTLPGIDSSTVPSLEMPKPETLRYLEQLDTKPERDGSAATRKQSVEQLDLLSDFPHSVESQNNGNSRRSLNNGGGEGEKHSSNGRVPGFLNACIPNRLKPNKYHEYRDESLNAPNKQ